MSQYGDLIDRASALDEQLREAYINKAREQKPKLEATGQCLYCEAELSDGQRFCDVECRDDWQRENDAKRRAGK